MQSGESGAKLAEMIKKAIRDLEVTDTEFDQIMEHAELVKPKVFSKELFVRAVVKVLEYSRALQLKLR